MLTCDWPSRTKRYKWSIRVNTSPLKNTEMSLGELTAGRASEPANQPESDRLEVRRRSDGMMCRQSVEGWRSADWSEFGADTARERGSILVVRQRFRLLYVKLGGVVMTSPHWFLDPEAWFLDVWWVVPEGER